MVNELRLGLRPDAAAVALGVGRDKVYELIGSGDLPSIKIGRARIIPVSAIEEFIARKLAEPV